MTSPVPDVLARAKLGPVTLRNRIAKAAIYGGTRCVLSTESSWGAISV